MRNFIKLLLRGTFESIYFVIGCIGRFTPNGEAKGQNALAIAKHTQSRLAEVVLAERDAIKAMNDWVPEPGKTSTEPLHVSLFCPELFTITLCIFTFNAISKVQCRIIKRRQLRIEACEYYTFTIV